MCVIPDHAHMSHIVTVTDIFGATIAVVLSILSANGVVAIADSARGGWGGHSNLDSFS